MERRKQHRADKRSIRHPEQLSTVAQEELAVMPNPEDLDGLEKQIREIVIPLAVALDVPKCDLDDAAEFVFSMVWEDFVKHKQEEEEGDIDIWRN